MKPVITIGSCVLGSAPRVALALRDQTSRTEVEACVAAGVDMLELRIDQFSDTAAAYVVEELRRFSGIPRIGTIRGCAEGGGWQGDEASRLALYQAVIPHVEAIDIEIAATDINDAVIRTAKDAGVIVIASYHDFTDTPACNDLENIAAQAEALGADIIKIAAHCDTAQDMRTLAGFLLGHTDKALVVIGMGGEGTCSRIFFPFLGSLITYTFLGAATAPGQLDCDETLRFLEIFHPGRAGNRK